MDFHHAEAYCLLKYVSKDQTAVEWLWNSRDGIVPYSIGPTDDIMEIGDEKMMSHVDWREDVRIPFFVPPVGMRIFVTYDQASAKEAWDRRMEILRKREIIMGDANSYRDEFVRDMVTNRQPRIVTVDETVRKEFAARALAASTQGLRTPR